jgi:phospholipid/cholesterol/gamma-HCH transport system permease protein
MTRRSFPGTQVIRYAGELGCIVGDSFRYTARQLVRARSPLRVRDVAAHVVEIGYRSLPVVCVVNFFVGMILAFQLAYILRLLGALPFLADIIGIAFLREMGPLLVGIVSAGFVGAASASEIGTMKVGDEILALEAGGLSPVKYLMVPRLLAAAMGLPLLAVVAAYAGNLGGFAVAVGLQGVDAPCYLNRLVEAVEPWDLLSGVIKAVIFGLLVGAVAVREGLAVEGGAAGVGRATTQAVVKSVVVVIAADLVLTYFLQMG